MYVAVKGGEKAIDNAHRWLAEVRRGDQAVPDLALDQIAEQLQLSVARVMAEGSLFDRELAALAIKQARGDMIEATFLIRAFRTTLPRFGGTRPINTGTMLCARRISATFKDIPGGQILGPTFDYTHRLLDFDLVEQDVPEPAALAEADEAGKPHVLGLLGRDGLMQTEAAYEDDAQIPDLTREPLSFPAERGLRLQALARGDDGFLLGLGYSTQRGYARNHAFVGELRIGIVEVEMDIP
ncbi:MAG: carbon-phosphorus lyase complex subunit PhnI, partial [Pseudomonadota bacterium]|nr:carbon-phosphorus lyase complex subunit PhnI [Pseudomonadota bacterium]